MKTTIEINGRIYDAQTGKILSNQSSSSTSNQVKVEPITQPVATTPALTLQRGVIMDGVSRKPANKPATPRQTVATRPASSIQKSRTLHRKAVTKPGKKESVPFVHGTSINAHSRVEQSATGRGVLLKRVPDVRLSRALIAKRSTLVSKFGRSSIAKPKLTHNLAVKQPPMSAPNSNLNAAPPLAIPTLPTNTGSNHDTKKHVFEDHIHHANSHLQKPVKKESKHKRLLRAVKISPKVLSAAAVVVAVTVLAGFFAYQNIPAVSMRVAAGKAGFIGKLPKNIPSGYGFNGPVQATNDNISLTYGSNSDGRSFTITQRPSSWSSEGLLTNYLLDSQFKYQAYKDKGLTVYIYNGSNATWVDKGVWFSVNGQEGALSSEQLLEIASSM